MRRACTLYISMRKDLFVDEFGFISVMEFLVFNSVGCLHF